MRTIGRTALCLLLAMISFPVAGQIPAARGGPCATGWMPMSGPDWSVCYPADWQVTRRVTGERVEIGLESSDPPGGTIVIGIFPLSAESREAEDPIVAKAVFDAIVTPEILRKVTGSATERYPLERPLGNYEAWLFTPDPLRFATIVRRKAMRGLYVFAMLPPRLHRTSPYFQGVREALERSIRFEPPEAPPALRDPDAQSPASLLVGGWGSGEVAPGVAMARIFAADGRYQERAMTVLEGKYVATDDQFTVTYQNGRTMTCEYQVRNERGGGRAPGGLYLEVRRCSTWPARDRDTFTELLRFDPSLGPRN